MLKKTVSKIVLVMLFLSMLLLMFKIQPAKSEQRTWIVDDDGPADFHTIQEAINVASNGDIIQVATGLYYGPVDVNKKISLVGENRDATTIDGSGYHYVVRLVNSSQLTGFTIRNGEYGLQVSTYAFFPSFTGIRIEGNRIVNNRYGGIYLRGCANNAVSNNIIANNTSFGIHLYHAGNNTLINNTIVNNGHGIDFYGNSNDNTLRNNNMTDNEYNFGLILRGETRNFLLGTSSKPGIVNDVDSSNTVNGKPIYYLVNRSDEQVPSDAGYVWLNNCTNITINRCNLSNNLQGVLLLLTNEASIINNNITGNAYGIYVAVYSSNNTIIDNTLKDNQNGIYLGDLSRFTTMRNNDISGSQMNFGVSPDIGRYGLQIGFPLDLINDIDTSNTVDGKPTVYWINQHDRQVPTNAGYVMLINCTNILIEGLNLSHNVQNIFILSTNNTVIATNSIANSVYGIDVRGVSCFFGTYFDYCASSNTIVEGNMLVDNAVGIRLRSNSSTVSNNTLLRNPLGISFQDTSNSIVSSNFVKESDETWLPSPGLELLIFYYPEWPWERSRELTFMQIGGIIVGGAYNRVICNSVVDSLFGISTYDQVQGLNGMSNLIFHNNFINNTRFQAMEAPKGSNYWDDGYPSGGNYWSEYNPPDEDKDKIGDSPYTIDENSTDRYPLIYTYGYEPRPDINKDEIINIKDLFIVAQAFGSKPGDNRWNPMADIEAKVVTELDETINIKDIYQIATNFGKEWKDF